MTKTISKKRVLSLALVVVMMFSVFAMSAYALDPGEYIPTLSIPNPYAPLHVFDFFDGNAIVGVNGDGQKTITLQVKDPVNVKVYIGGILIYDEDGHVIDVLYEGEDFVVSYDEETGALIITIINPDLDVDWEYFSISLTFDLEIGSPPEHDDYTATLTLEPVED
jgi:hypothetical protein